MPHTPPAVDDVVAALTETFGPVESSVYRGQTRVVIPPAEAFAAFRELSAAFDRESDLEEAR